MTRRGANLDKMDFNDIIFSLCGGILPSFLWLWFWLREDRLHPEPRRLLFLTFLFGMLSVIPALLLEQGIAVFLRNTALSAAAGGFLILALWALVEEIVKYVAAKEAALKKKDFDEPVDALVYMITAALGFAALENVIFLVQTCMDYGILSGFVIGNLRFVGATLIHILSSATVGASIAFCFFHKEKRGRNLFFGIFFATLLHALFNYFIIESGGKNVFGVFAPFWVLVIPLLYVFDKVKKLKQVIIKKNNYPTCQ